ncbi:unnamed protein product, partial [Effrenium voratum]
RSKGFCQIKHGSTGCGAMEIIPSLPGTFAHQILCFICLNLSVGSLVISVRKQNTPLTNHRAGSGAREGLELVAAGGFLICAVACTFLRDWMHLQMALSLPIGFMSLVILCPLKKHLVPLLPLKLCKDDLHRAERGEAEEAVLITPEAEDSRVRARWQRSQ